MQMTYRLVLLLTLLSCIHSTALAQIIERERPAEWKNLVPGGQFKDLILPIPVREGYTSETWGGDNVRPRDIKNGRVSDWFKFERIRFLFDEYKRPTHVYFAVTDVNKHDDLPNDTHNGKLITLPMRLARRLEMLKTKPITLQTKEIRVKLLAEDTFDPHRDVCVKTLRYGNADEVNYGRGSQVLRTEKSGKDLILVFAGQDCRFTQKNFAGKLLGRNREREILFGWSDLPDTERKVSLLSPLMPKFEFANEDLEAYIEVENFGEIQSEISTLKLLLGKHDIGQVIASGQVRSLQPFEKTMVRVVCTKKLKRGSQHIVSVVIDSNSRPTEFITKKVRLP